LRNLSLRTEKINNEECIMKKYLLQSAIVLIAIAGLLMMVGCDTAVDDIELSIPANVSINVEGRTMTVTWDAVPNAQGYEIYTTSENCGSGNKIINTKNNTATNLEGEGSYVKDDKSNGAVEILTSTSIQITLMPMTMGSSEPMATAVTAKVKALGGEAGGNNYLNSGYSAVVDKPLGGMGM
jgi:fibronectin type 3 domain-containing protein